MADVSFHAAGAHDVVQVERVDARRQLQQECQRLPDATRSACGRSGGSCSVMPLRSRVCTARRTRSAHARSRHAATHAPTTQTFTPGGADALLAVGSRDRPASAVACARRQSWRAAGDASRDRARRRGRCHWAHPARLSILQVREQRAHPALHLLTLWQRHQRRPRNAQSSSARYYEVLKRLFVAAELLFIKRKGARRWLPPAVPLPTRPRGGALAALDFAR